ncbi:amino acid permease, partial [Streptomyces decoyicus]
VIITVLFMLPQLSPVTIETFNYAPITVGVVLVFAGTWWFVSARKWFLNPRHPRNNPSQTPVPERATAP